MDNQSLLIELKETQNISIHEEMRHEMMDKGIFEQVKEYAYEYADSAFERNVYPTPEAIEQLKVFNEALPDMPHPPEDILEMLHKYGSPATSLQIGGRYFGFVIGGTIPIALAARWLADFWDQNAGLYVISPIVSKLETIVEKWLLQLFNLPDTAAAGFVSGTTMANLCALAAARYRILKRANWDVNLKGMFNAPNIRIVAGMQAHASVSKAISILGFGLDNVEWVEVDNQGRIIPEKIPALDENTILILQAGNVNSGSFDFFDNICKLAKKTNTWVHIDGAFGLWASCSENLNHLTKGIEKADSWSVDAHKTLNTPYDCGIVLCNDSEALVASMQVTGSYLLYSENRDGALYTPELSRRARIVELWATIKYLGQQGINDLVYGLHERALQFANELRDNGFQIVNNVVFNQVLVRCENDEITRKTLELIQQSGECWCGSSKWDNRYVIRISVCSWATTQQDISRSVRAFVKAYKEATRN